MTAKPRPLAFPDEIVRNDDPQRRRFQADKEQPRAGYTIASLRSDLWVETETKCIHLDGKPRRSGWSRVEKRGK